MPKKVIQFYVEPNGTNRAFWITDGTSIEFSTRSPRSYPLPKRFLKTPLSQVNKTVVERIRTAGIDPKSGKLTLPAFKDAIEYNYKNEFEESKKVVSKMITEMETEVTQELDLGGIRKKWPNLAVAKYKWEFLRRSKLFHFECDKLIERRNEEYFEDVWISGSSAGFEILFPASLNDELANFLFICGLPPSISFSSGMIFTNYKLGFEELIIFLGIFALLNKLKIENIINGWTNEFIYSESHPFRGYPGPLLSVKLNGPRYKSEKTKVGEKRVYYNCIEFELKLDGTKSKEFQTSLSQTGLPIFSAEEHFSNSNQYKIKFRVALPGFPHAYTISHRNGVINIYNMVRQAISESIGFEMPYVDPKNEMRFTALDGQLEILDGEIGWNKYPHEKESTYYKWRDSAHQKIKSIETAINKRKSIIKSIN